MQTPKYVLDTSVIINHLNSKVDIEAFFATLPKCARFISGITDIEALAMPGMTRADIVKTKAFLFKFNSVDLLPVIKEEAAKLRREYKPKLKLPDAIIAATSIALGATLLSNDSHLLSLVCPGYSVHSI